MEKLHFATFANTGYLPSTDRITSEALTSGWFASVRSYSEVDFPTFFRRHRLFLAAHRDSKFGFFFWKPAIILGALQSIEEGETLVYADSGMKINRQGAARLTEYLEILDQGNDFVLFSTNSYYEARSFVKADAAAAYLPEIYNTNVAAVYAGIMLVRKTIRSMSILREWSELCETTQFVVPGKSVSNPDPKGYLGQDGDNGLLQLVALKHRLFSVYPDEINLYHRNGRQAIHVLSESRYLKLDWSSLSDIPFQMRRIRK